METEIIKKLSQQLDTKLERAYAFISSFGYVLSDPITGEIWGSEDDLKVTGLILRECNLSDDILSQIVPILREFKYLASLDLSYNTLQFIKCLEKVNQLEELILHGNNVEDIDSLCHLENLKKISISHDLYFDSGQISNLTNLEELYIDDVPPIKTKSFENLKKLTFLHLESAGIRDISFLNNLTQLTYLSLNRNQIGDITAINNLNNLVHLSLRGNKISSLESLKKQLPNLKKLEIDNNQITDHDLIIILKRCPNLEKVKFSNNYCSPRVKNLEDVIELRNYYKNLENNKGNLKTNFRKLNFKIDINMDEVFISYSWDNKEHEQKVLEFTEHLRKNGYDAKIDKMISQQETATNFVKMMHLSMLNHQKIVVVLSEGYKKKAEAFTGGVGEEYQLLLSDISKNPKKYILMSFQGRSDEIIPFGLQGRDIIDLSSPNGLELLFRKLSGKDKYVFSEVAAKKPDLESVQIGDFKTLDPTKIISIENPTIKVDNSSSTGGLYRDIEFKVIFGFKNIFGKSIEGFAYEIKIKRELIPKSYYESIQDGYYVISESVPSKLFPNATAKTEILTIKVAAHSIHQILGTVITVKVHTDYGTHVREFRVEELFKVNPPSQTWGEPSPLTPDLFL